MGHSSAGIQFGESIYAFEHTPGLGDSIVLTVTYSTVECLETTA